MKPRCHNHPEYSRITISEEFRMVVENRNSKACGHWKPLGNAHVRLMGDDVGGKTFSWEECDGCKWKERK